MPQARGTPNLEVVPPERVALAEAFALHCERAGDRDKSHPLQVWNIRLRKRIGKDWFS
jgi:hypothetical protein